MTRKLHLVAGTRPNFVKLAALVHELREEGEFQLKIVHTGQHYDDSLSGIFFRALDIPRPDVNLGVNSASKAIHFARVMEGAARVFSDDRPDAVVLFGDVNSTLAAAFSAATLKIPTVHVEAGLRSFDRDMPEEINRLMTDAMASLLLVSEPSGVRNLQSEGVASERIHHVGNIVVDGLTRILPRAEELKAYEKHGVEPGQYGLLTMDRPSNVDDPKILGRLLDLFSELSEQLPIVFPMHPRTRRDAERAGLRLNRRKRLLLTEPADYTGTLCMQKNAKVLFTDSGRMQEESTCLAVPCLTLRSSTERPITVDEGTSTLVGNDTHKIRTAFDSVMAGTYKTGKPISLWDGNTAKRIVGILQQHV